MAENRSTTQLDLRVNARQLNDLDKRLQSVFDAKRPRDFNREMRATIRALQEATRAAQRLNRELGKLGSSSGLKGLIRDLRGLGGGPGGGGGGGGMPQAVGGGGGMPQRAGATSRGGLRQMQLPLPGPGAAAAPFAAIPFIGGIAAGSIMAGYSMYGSHLRKSQAEQSTYAYLGSASTAMRLPEGDPDYQARMAAATAAGDRLVASATSGGGKRARRAAAMRQRRQTFGRPIMDQVRKAFNTAGIYPNTLMGRALARAGLAGGSGAPKQQPLYSGTAHEDQMVAAISDQLNISGMGQPGFTTSYGSAKKMMAAKALQSNPGPIRNLLRSIPQHGNLAHPGPLKAAGDLWVTMRKTAGFTMSGNPAMNAPILTGSGGVAAAKRQAAALIAQVSSNRGGNMNDLVTEGAKWGRDPAQALNRANAMAQAMGMRPTDKQYGFAEGQMNVFGVGMEQTGMMQRALLSGKGGGIGARGTAMDAQQSMLANAVRAGLQGSELSQYMAEAASLLDKQYKLGLQNASTDELIKTQARFSKMTGSPMLGGRIATGAAAGIGGIGMRGGGDATEYAMLRAAGFKGGGFEEYSEALFKLQNESTNTQFLVPFLQQFIAGQGVGKAGKGRFIQQAMAKLGVTIHGDAAKRVAVNLVKMKDFQGTRNTAGEAAAMTELSRDLVTGMGTTSIEATMEGRRAGVGASVAGNMQNMNSALISLASGMSALTRGPLRAFSRVIKSTARDLDKWAKGRKTYLQIIKDKLGL